MPHRIRRAITCMTAAVLSLALASGACAEVKVMPTSPRLGQIFPDDEPVDFKVQVSGAPGPATLDYTVTETEGPFKTHDNVPIEIKQGDGLVTLPLKLPNRGHYDVTLVVTSGDQTVKKSTTIGIVFPPAKPDPASSFGVMFTPPIWWGRKDYVKSAEEAAENLHMLGVAWVRDGAGGYSYGEIKIAQRDGKPFVTCDPFLLRTYLQAMRKHDINILYTIGGMPRVLSSRPNDTSTVRDSGELWGRVKPRDYAEWDSLVTNLVSDFKKDVAAWEIENEANMPELGYWSGTPEELLEFVAHTSRAIKAGNPAAKVMGCGFVHPNALAEKLIAAGITKNFDVISLHYLNYFDEMKSWQDLLKKHKIDLPIWCSEERFEIPSISLTNGVQRSFDFMQVNLPGPAGEGDYGGLCNTDYTPRARGVEFSVASHIIGGAKLVESRKLGEDYLALRYSQGKREIMLLTRLKEATTLDRMTLTAKPIDSQTPIALTNRLGRTEPLTLKDGQVEIPLQNRKTLFIHNAQSLEFVDPNR